MPRPRHLLASRGGSCPPCPCSGCSRPHPEHPDARIPRPASGALRLLLADVLGVPDGGLGRPLHRGARQREPARGRQRQHLGARRPRVHGQLRQRPVELPERRPGLQPAEPEAATAGCNVRDADRLARRHLPRPGAHQDRPFRCVHRGSGRDRPPALSAALRCQRRDAGLRPLRRQPPRAPTAALDREHASGRGLTRALVTGRGRPRLRLHRDPAGRASRLARR